MKRIRDTLRRIELATRPVSPEVATALERVWNELPDHAQVANQTMGRHTTACEGTHGVFPKCDFRCTPCYHSKEANLVRIDGDHTVREVDRQMAYMRKRRGPGQYAQLIGGEVSLLTPEDHARALQTMVGHERKPMSFTHGDFDYETFARSRLTTTTSRGSNTCRSLATSTQRWSVGVASRTISPTT